MKTAHKLYDCKGCERGCVYCQGGLAFCEVCKGAEATLPTDCPGIPMEEYTQEAVSLGVLDYIDGGWVST